MVSSNKDCAEGTPITTAKVSRRQPLSERIREGVEEQQQKARSRVKTAER
jgi:hypothetical protein